jgi:hypothetical protein
LNSDSALLTSLHHHERPQRRWSGRAVAHGKGQKDMARAFGAIHGVFRVEGLRGPYDFVIYAARRAQVDVLERLAGVIRAEVCWLSRSCEGGIG